MNYTVRVFIKSGFNSVNIPDTPALLNTIEHIDLPAIDIAQQRFLSSVRCDAVWETVKDADYALVGDFYYFIDGIEMINNTTAELKLTPDFLTSAGGLENVSLLDGMTDRISVGDDAWGKYDESDPLTAPQAPLQLDTEWVIPSIDPVASDVIDTGMGDNKTKLDDPIFVESSVDLPKQYAQRDGISYTDSETGKTVTCPATNQIGTENNASEGTYDQRTYFEIDETTGKRVTNGDAVFCVNDTRRKTHVDSDQLYASAGTAVRGGMQAVQSIGVAQGSIINQWRIPYTFISGITSDVFIVGDGRDGSKNTTGQFISLIKGRNGTLNPTIKPVYATVKNLRALYGDYQKYGLMTTAGNSAEFKPEEITTETEAPEISYRADPRPKGKPYFRFTTINGNNEFWRNALAGSEWENVPLIYQGSSGSALTRLNFNNQRAIAKLEKGQYDTNYYFAQAETASQMASSAGEMIAGAAMMMPAGSAMASQMPGFSKGAKMSANGAGGLVSGMMSLAQNYVAKEQYAEIYKREKANELSKLYQETTVYAPTVNFPYNADILRDVEGNGVLLYKFKYQEADLERIDKLLTMYGYKVIEAISGKYVYRRTHFDYVAFRSVSVTDFPRWWNNGIVAQLENGVRIWHEKPNTQAYLNNPIRS